MVDWRIKNREKARIASSAWKKRNRDKVLVKNREWLAAHPDRIQDYRAREMKDRDTRRAASDRRRLRLKDMTVGVFTIHVASPDCGVCLNPLTEERWPHPMATSFGHEPPVVAIARDGWRVMAVRPEHLICNQRKSGRTDAEMIAAIVR
jgi:hypothetical protein